MSNEKLAPIALFAFKRIDTLKLTVEALQKNFLASQSDLIVFSDAAKKEQDILKVEEVRIYLKTIDGFKSVTIYEAPQNKGLANSIIDGVTEVLYQYESVIVLEDDLKSTPNFLSYHNAALTFYKNEQKIFSIAGFSMPIKSNDTFDVYFTMRSNSTGWSTWKDRWKKIDWKVTDYESFKNNTKKQQQFNKMGSDMSSMLKRQMSGKLDSWAIRWCYHQFKFDLFSVHPIASKIENIGFDSNDASNTKEKFNRFATVLDDQNKTEFKFIAEPKLDTEIISQFVAPFSIKNRIKYKIINFLNLK